MPKVQTKANIADGSFTTIDVPTNRQGAEKARIAAHADPVKAPAANGNGAAPADPPKGATQEPPAGNSASAASQAAAAEAPAEDPNDTGLEDEDKELAERAQKKIAKKHREMRQAEALATKLRAELADTEDFSKSQYNRARLAEERVAELQGELEALKGTAPEVQAPPAGPKKPETKDFYDDKNQFKFAEYTEAVAEYSAQKALADERAKREAADKKAAEERAEKARAEAAALAESRVAEARKRYPDYDKKLDASTVQVHNLVSAYLSASERIGDLSYYLATHPDYAERLNKMHPLAAVAEIGRLESKWIKPEAPTAAKGEEGAPPARGASVTPAPINPLPGMGSAGVTADPSKMTPAQLREYDRERRAAKIRARH